MRWQHARGRGIEVWGRNGGGEKGGAREGGVFAGVVVAWAIFVGNARHTIG